MRCETGPVIPLPRVHLFHSPQKCERFLRRRGQRLEVPQYSEAVSYMFDHGGEAYACVLLSPEEGMGQVAISSMLAHEAVHVMRYAFECIGEGEPAEEETAYVTQCVHQALMTAHVRWLEKRLRHGRRS